MFDSWILSVSYFAHLSLVPEMSIRGLVDAIGAADCFFGSWTSKVGLGAGALTGGAATDVAMTAPNLVVTNLSSESVMWSSR